jgi:hypothetical protein
MPKPQQNKQDLEWTERVNNTDLKAHYSLREREKISKSFHLLDNAFDYLEDSYSCDDDQSKYTFSKESGDDIDFKLSKKD